MSVCFVFEPAAWEHPIARWTLRTVADLLEIRTRDAQRGEPVATDVAVVHVGAERNAPPSSAAVIVFEQWPEWDPRTLRLADVSGVQLPCPAGVERVEHGAHGPRVFPAQWLRALGFMLTREEEFLDHRRDQWDCFSGTFSRMHELGALDEPLVNRCARELERTLVAWHEARGRTPERFPRWKGGARFAVALTHDVDDVAFYSLRGAARLVTRARRPRSYAVRGGLAAAARALSRGGRADPYDQFDRWVAEEERHGFRSSYFFVPPVPSRSHEYDPTYGWGDPVTFEGRRTTVGGMMQRMAARGLDVGLHGSYLSHLDSGELRKQKISIETASRHPVAGGRQHFLRFDVRTTWRAQAGAGLAYDTTLGYNEEVGFRAGIAAPFRPWDPERRAAHDLVELPLTAMDGALFRSLHLDANGATERVRRHLERVEEVGGLAVLLWHPNAATEELFPGWWRSWTATLDWLATRGAWVTSAAEIAAWWKGRPARGAPRT